MALTLVKEDGSGKTDANSYADVADGDAYHDGHLYASAWTGATPDRKAAAVVFATRLIDSQYQFNGWRANGGQGLQWPRDGCPDPDRGLWATSVLLPMRTNFVDGNVIPGAVVQATCEMARELLIADRTAAAAGEGIDSVQTGHSSQDVGGTGISSESSTTKYSKADTRPIISPVARAMLGKFGALISGGGGVVRLVRA
jgi:hypothetical protein